MKQYYQILIIMTKYIKDTQFMTPWTEKYRPSTISEIKHQSNGIKIMEMCKETKEFPHLLIYGKSGIGKCLSGDTKILMFDGNFKFAKDIKIGDKLMGDDNTSRTVKSTVEGHDDMYTIVQNIDESYVVNSSHVLCLKLMNEFVVVGLSLYWFENHGLHSKKFRNKKSLDNFKIRLKADNKNNKYGETVDISLQDYNNKSIIWKESYYGYASSCIIWSKTVHDSQNKMCELSPYHYGRRIVDNYSPENFNYYKFDSLENRNRLLEGIFESFGIIKYYEGNIYSPYFAISSEKIWDNEKLLSDIIFVAKSTGLKYNNGKIYGYNMKNIVKRYGNSNLSYDHKIMFNNIFVERNKDEDTYYGFEIDGNGRFLLDDFTVTHNTSTILALAKELFPPNIFGSKVMELNASDERGIKIVRTKIKNFANLAVNDTSPDVPPYKLVILDEAGSMTENAQSALRKIIEDTSKVTRFCFICNYINQIIEPLVSRCVKVHFLPIPKRIICDHLKYISDEEKLKITESALKKISKIGDGDLRKSIIMLQNLKYLDAECIDKHMVEKINNHIPTSVVSRVITICSSQSSMISDIVKVAKSIIRMGYSSNDVMDKILKYVLNMDICENIKCKIISHIFDSMVNISEYGDEYVQLLYCLSNIHKEFIN